ncbi:MAG: hypothetical protein ABWK00_05955 [Desulfurococcaceae archaeon]
MPIKRGVVYAAAVLMALASAAMHFPSGEPPLGLWGLRYSDVVYGVFYTRFSPGLFPSEVSSLWLRPEAYYRLINDMSGCPAPYVDYRFEYPPLVAALWYATTCAGFALSPLLGGSGSPQEFVDVAAVVHYLLQSVAAAAALIASARYLLLLLEPRGRAGEALAYVLMPSLLFYLTYNWDILAAAFAVASLYYYYGGKPARSGAMIALSVMSKALTAGLALLALACYLARGRRREAGMYLLGALASGLALLIPLLALAPGALQQLYEHHSGWYCENCVSMLIFHDVWSPAHKYFFVAASPAVLATLAWLAAKGRADLLEISYAAVAPLVVLNYVFSPQMCLMLQPFAVLSGLAAPYAIADALNASFIVLFFEDAEVRRALGLGGGFDPWELSSPAQWVAQARNVILVALLAVVLHRAAREVLGRGRGPPR